MDPFNTCKHVHICAQFQLEVKVERFKSAVSAAVMLQCWRKHCFSEKAAFAEEDVDTKVCQQTKKKAEVLSCQAAFES